MNPPSIVVRAHRDSLYQTVHLHAHDNDSSLSWRAVGLLTYLLTRPAGWALNMADVLARHTEGRDAVQRALKELERGGYLHREKVRGEGGKLSGYVWHVRERPSAGGLETGLPVAAGGLETRLPENPVTGKPGHIAVQQQEEQTETQVAVTDTAPAALDVGWMHELWLRELSNGHAARLTTARVQKYRAMHAEQLAHLGEEEARAAWVLVLRAVRASEHHMSKLQYHLPESFLKNAERRDMWVGTAARLVQASQTRHERADRFAALYYERRRAREA